jgi:hypothetical protein
VNNLDLFLDTLEDYDLQVILDIMNFINIYKDYKITMNDLKNKLQEHKKYPKASDILNNAIQLFIYIHLNYIPIKTHLYKINELSKKIKG